MNFSLMDLCCSQCILCCAVVMVTVASLQVDADDDASVSRQRRSPAGGAGGGYHEQHHYKPSKKCYQCAYSPPKTVYEKYQSYGHGHGGHGQGGHGQGGHGNGGYGHQSYGHHASTVHGGWDKCLGPFDHYQAKAYGIDVWDCHYNNCYVRRDHNGDIFRGCYKGEYGVDQHLYGCHYQGGSTYCFCEGELCNNGPAPH